MNFFHLLFYAILGVSLVSSQGRKRPNNNNNDNDNNNNNDDDVNADTDIEDTDTDTDNNNANDDDGDDDQEESTSLAYTLTEYLSAKDFLKASFESGDLPVALAVRLGESTYKQAIFYWCLVAEILVSSIYTFLLIL